VDGYAVHAVMVNTKFIRHEIGTDADHRVDGAAVHPTRLRLNIKLNSKHAKNRDFSSGTDALGLV